jgi:hypothetical protein
MTIVLMMIKVGISVDAANARYSADILPRGDRMASALQLAWLERSAKYFLRCGAAKSTNARTLGTAKRPSGARS